MVILSGLVLTKPLNASQAGLGAVPTARSLTHSLQELLQFERLLLTELVPKLLGLQLLLLVFLLGLGDGSVKNVETSHLSALRPVVMPAKPRLAQHFNGLALYMNVNLILGISILKCLSFSQFKPSLTNKCLFYSRL